MRLGSGPASVGTFPDVREQLARAESILVGHEIVGVQYVLPASVTEDDADTEVDSVRIGVELSVRGGGTCSVTWHTAGKCEGLMVGPGRVDCLRTIPMALRRKERTQSTKWQPFIDRRVRALRVSWQESSEGCPPTLWAIQLKFDTDELMIALGEAGPDGARYQPDELVVIFDAELAAAYRRSHHNHGADRRADRRPAQGAKKPRSTWSRSSVASQRSPDSRTADWVLSSGVTRRISSSSTLGRARWTTGTSR